MRISFEEEKKKAMEDPEVTDRVGKETLSSVISAEGSQAQKKFDQASDKRLGPLREQHEAAYTYLALGIRQLRNQDLTIRSEGATVPLTRLFHFAGHLFRETGQLNRAADAYWRAGVANGKHVDDFAIRSLARAKMCCAEIGESDESDRMHKLEWEARRALALWPKRVLLTAWRCTTGYGTSLQRWVCSLLWVLTVFSVLYAGLHAVGAIAQGRPWTWISAVYFCIVTTATVGYGDFTPSDWVGELVVVANVIVGYIMLAFGATILGRKVLGR